VFVIAHRPETVEGADLVLVLRDGRVEAFGTPADVAARSETYRRLRARGLADDPADERGPDGPEATPQG
jgi:ATP-binding cassette subfamily B protein